MENKLYEYAVIRIVPRVEREEFINAGIILFCKKDKYLNCRYRLNVQKLLSLYDKADIRFIEENLHAFQCIAMGKESASSISGLEAPERFRWLTATRSTVIQASKVHPGLCFNHEETLEKLFREYVE